MITETDLVAMEALARTTTERVAQEEQLRKSGPLYKTKSGYIQVSPLFSVVSTLRERELKLLREFGMTPSSRTRVQVAREEGMEDHLGDSFAATREARHPAGAGRRAGGAGSVKPTPVCAAPLIALTLFRR